MTFHCHNGEKGSAKLAALATAAAAVLLAAAGFAWSKGLLRQQPELAAEPSLVTLSSDRLDFGNVALNGHAIRKLILLNEGDKPIQAHVAVTTDVFAVDPESLLLHPGVSAQVTVELDARALGAFEDEIKVILESAGEAPLVVALEADVKEPGSVEPGAPLTLPQQLALDASRAKRIRRDGGSFDPGAQDAGQLSTERARAEGGDGYFVGGGNGQGHPNITSQGTEASAPGEPTTTTAAARKTHPGSREDATERDGTGSSLPPGMGVNVRPYDPANSAPFRSVSDNKAPGADSLTEGEQGGPNKLPSRVSGDELPETLPEDPETDEPALGPTLTISGVSTVRLMGSQAAFYPQRLDVAGADLGGPFNLGQPMQFPTVPLAFGESMLFAQTGAPGGTWDPLTGEVRLDLPIQAVDTDGDAAPLTLRLTTGTAMARNESGAVVAIDGSPRVAKTGVLRLVAVEKIPVGFKNGGEDRLTVFEILANLSFGNEGPAKNGFGRIGG